MRLQNILVGLFLVMVLYCMVRKSVEGFKNVDTEAANQVMKIKTKILPSNSLCVRGAQCISGQCLRNNNEATYGYCK